jgi:Flp pilus assembly protein TadD
LLNITVRVKALPQGRAIKADQFVAFERQDKISLLRRHPVKNRMDHILRIILILLFYALFFPANIQQTQAKSRDAEAHNNRGNTHADKGQYDQAISEYTKALKMDPRYTEAYYNRGYAYTSKGQSDDAIRDFNKALDLNPKYAKAYHIRGIAYATKGQYGQALSDYTKALELNPQDAIAYCNRGIAHYFRKEYEKSWEDVRKAHSLGYQIDPRFLGELRKASGRKN